MAELAERETVYSLFPWIKNSKYWRDWFLCLALGKKTGSLGVPSSKRNPVSEWKTYYNGINSLISFYC